MPRTQPIHRFRTSSTNQENSRMCAIHPGLLATAGPGLGPPQYSPSSHRPEGDAILCTLTSHLQESIRHRRFIFRVFSPSKTAESHGPPSVLDWHWPSSLILPEPQCAKQFFSLRLAL